VRRAGVRFPAARHVLTAAASILPPSDVAVISAGDKVFGVTLFGGYSTRVLVPTAQTRPRLPDWTAAECASLPAGDVGSMLVQMSATLSLGPVGVPPRFYGYMRSRFELQTLRCASWISSAEWARMAWRMWATPAFDPMDLTVFNRR